MPLTNGDSNDIDDTDNDNSNDTGNDDDDYVRTFAFFVGKSF